MALVIPWHNAQISKAWNCDSQGAQCGAVARESLCYLAHALNDNIVQRLV